MEKKIDSLYLKKYFKKHKVILAPMAGITSFSYRKFMSKFKPAMVFSEMISDCGLIYDNKETIKLLYTDNKEKMLGIQLFGGQKENLLKALEILENLKINYDFLDLNLACPVKKVTKNNGGSAWLRDINKLKEMVSLIVKKSKNPVTCKIRLGIDDKSINFIDVCKTLEECGVIYISIHARTTKQLYSGEPRYELLKDLHKYISIPFGISGNIFKVEDAVNALKITGADCVLVARGGVGNPLLIKEINYFVKKGKIKHLKRSVKKQVEYCLKFSKMLIDEKGEDVAIKILRGIAPKFFTGMPNMKEIRINLTKINTFNDLYQTLKEINNV